MKKRKDNRYRRKVPYEGKDGKTRYRDVYGSSPAEADENAATLKAQLRKGINEKAAKDSFQQWVERFLAKKEAAGVSFKQYSNLENFCKHLSPLNSLPLPKINAGDIQDIILALAKGDGIKKPLGWRSLVGVKQAASGVFKLAMAQRVVEYNPAEYVEIPKNAPRSERTAIEEFQREWVDDTPHRAQRAAMLMLYAGLRRGEMLALTWADINLEEQTVTVRRQAVYENSRPVVKSVKTDAGQDRVVDIPDNLVEYLRAEQGKDDCIYLVHTYDGRILPESSWRDMWKSYMRDLNIKYAYKGTVSKYDPKGIEMLIETFTPHQLRHTFCTMLFAAGYTEAEARDQMGHEDVQTTINIYTHLRKLKERPSKGKLSKYLGRGSDLGVNQKKES